MKKKLYILLVVCGGAGLPSFLLPNNNPRQQLAAWYSLQFRQLNGHLQQLQNAVYTNQPLILIRANFKQARLDYKRLEWILAYYFEGDLNCFNGPATPFIEEEDPSAHQEPQGFQMIESFIYPDYQVPDKQALLGYINKMRIIAEGLGNNPGLFKPDAFIPDAFIEELYRILALGITGFDSPLAHFSLQEAHAALGSLLYAATLYKEDWQAADASAYQRLLTKIHAATGYISQHTNFERFNRMEFIVKFLNPLCEAMGRIKNKGRYPNNTARYSLIKKNGSLFTPENLDRSRYKYDDTLNLPAIELGRQLFYEPLLSVNNNRSCAGCHRPEKAFTDGLPKALQLDEHSSLPRNTPTLWNAALQMNLFYDSRQTKMEDLVLEVLANEKEMNSGAAASVHKLRENSHYRTAFRLAYADTAIQVKNIANAIARYLQTLVSYNARFDKYMRGKQAVLDTTEINGFNLFAGKARCATCHYIPLFNGSKPPLYYYQESEVIGVPATADTVSPAADADPGRVKILALAFFDHSFKTPGLRNIALTAPYMHNGVYQTLEEVIDFYDRGGGQGTGVTTPYQTLPPTRLNLSKTEKMELKAFLLTLTDTATAVHY
jgi:cytochrome c peroxidase